MPAHAVAQRRASVVLVPTTRPAHLIPARIVEHMLIRVDVAPTQQQAHGRERRPAVSVVLLLSCLIVVASCRSRLCPCMYPSSSFSVCSLFAHRCDCGFLGWWSSLTPPLGSLCSARLCSLVTRRLLLVWRALSRSFFSVCPRCGGCGCCTDPHTTQQAHTTKREKERRHITQRQGEWSEPHDHADTHPDERTGRQAKVTSQAVDRIWPASSPMRLPDADRRPQSDPR